MYLFELPTTGALSLGDVLTGNTSDYTSRISDATSARTNVRSVLKETKRAGNESDFVKVVKIIDDYVPHLAALIHGQDLQVFRIQIQTMFSWRTTLSENFMNQSPRLNFPGLHADLHFCLLTSSFALCNAANAIVSSLGDYERQKYTSEPDRKSNDDRVNLAVTFLCRASGIFSYLAEVVLPPLRSSSTASSPLPRVPDVDQDVMMALAKLCLAEAQALAIRKLLSKSYHDSTLAVGPPLPKSHPPPGLVAKLCLHQLELYNSALGLVKLPSNDNKNSAGSKSRSKDGASAEVVADLRRYLSKEAALTEAVAHMWLGVEAGTVGRTGEAISYLTWAKDGLSGSVAEAFGRLKLSASSKRGKEMKTERKDRVDLNLDMIRSFLDTYTKENNSVSFQPVPSRQSLQASLPSGRAVVNPKVYIPPAPAFSMGEPVAADGELISAEPSGTPNPKDTPTPSYAGAGSYF